MIKMLELINFILIIFILCVILKGGGLSKSKGYRKTLTDLYVAAKIRKLSKEDGLDIVEEYESFKSWVKKKSIETQSLDDTIEEDLQGRINEKKSKEKTKEEK